MKQNKINLKYSLTVLLVCSGIGLKAQQAAVLKGTIASEKGELLNGAIVKVFPNGNGTPLTAITNAKGIFIVDNLTAGSQVNLITMFAGYKNDTLYNYQINGKDNNSLIIRLQPDTKKLGEVVVTALGIKREQSKLGYSVQVVKGDGLTKAPDANPLSGLTGKVSGLNIYNNNEMLNAPQYNLRGATPVIVIDGVPVSTNFYDVKPDDIESISVLKGTTASALYGSRGKDGAIMITTKRGNIGKNGVEVQLNSSNMFQIGFLTLPQTQKKWGTGNNGQYTLTEDLNSPNGDAGGGAGSWGPELDAGNNVVQWDSPIDPATGKRTPTPWVSRGKNNLKNFVQNGLISSNNLSVSKSFEKGSLRFSLSHMYQKGQIPNTKLNITGFSLASNVNLTSKLHADGYLSYTKQYTPNYPFAGYGRKNSIYNILIWEGVDTDIRDFKNYWQKGKEGYRQLWYNYSEYNNPWFVAHEFLHEHKKDVITGHLSLTYDITPSFSLMGRVTVNNSSRFGSLQVPYSFMEYQGRTISFGLKGGYQTENETNFDLNTDFLATYNKRFSQNLQIQLVGGGNVRYAENRMQGLKADGLNVPGVYTFANASNPLLLPQADVTYIDRQTNFLNKQQVNSLYISADISFFKAFNLGLTGRMDQSSALPISNNRYFYPSAALAVVVSDLIRMPQYISYAKIRSSVAQVSSDLAVYQLAQAYNPGIIWSGNTSVNMPGNLNNPNIMPAKSTTTEVGGEIYFFGNRLRLDMAYFRTLDQNQIIQLPSSPAAGFSSHTKNANEFFRKGGEVSLGATPVQHGNFRWNTSVNWGTFKQTVKTLDPVLNGNYNGMKEGERLDQIINSAFAYMPEGKIIVGNNGLPTRNPNNVLRGYSNPDWSGGWSNTFLYRNFALKIDLDGRFGGTIYSQTREKMVSAGVDVITDDEFNRRQFNKGIASMVIDGVLWDASNSKYVQNTKAISTYDYFNAYNSSSRANFNYLSGTFAKLREVSITYNLPKSLLAATSLKDASFSLVGKNLLIISNSILKNYADPDAGSDNLQTPAPRNFGFNLNVKF